MESISDSKEKEKGGVQRVLSGKERGRMTRAKTDCFAYKPGQQKPPRRKAECMALDKLYCRDGECRFYKDRQDMVGYPKDECDYTQNVSMAGKLIRAQAEQIRETPAEYLARKFDIRGDADGQKHTE